VVVADLPFVKKVWKERSRPEKFLPCKEKPRFEEEMETRRFGDEGLVRDSARRDTSPFSHSRARRLGLGGDWQGYHSPG
jgi:hypothetical protein